MKYIRPTIIRQVFVLLLILLMGGLIFQEMLTSHSIIKDLAPVKALQTAGGE